MVPLSSLWLPILVSAALVFIASSVIHMVLGYHAADWKKLPSDDAEKAVQDALRRANVPPGDYRLPWATTSAEMNSPEFRAKGPVVVMTTWPAGQYGMGKSLVLWFLYGIVVSVFAGYIAGSALGPGARYLEVFRFAGTVGFAAYALALMQDSIWYHRRWATTLRSMADGLLYGLLIAGVFGWLWPR